ncbi:MAG: efflux RND transporter permease subunit [Steroidobacteraceae bacterium]
MSFSAWIERHRRSLLTVAFALALAGAFAAITLPVGLFPVTSFPRIRVEVDAGSMPAKQMLIDVTEPLEQVARAVPAAREVTSTTSREATSSRSRNAYGPGSRHDEQRRLPPARLRSIPSRARSNVEGR